MSNGTDDFLTDWAAGSSTADDAGTTVDDGGNAEDTSTSTDDTGTTDASTVDNGDGSDAADPSAPTADEDPNEGKNVPYAAMRAERQARKAERERAEAAEKRAKELEAQIDALRNPAPATAQPAQAPATETATPPDFWSDPQGFIAAQIASAGRDLAQQTHFRAIEDRQRALHDDFDAVSGFALEAAKRDPALANRILTATDPGAELYAVGKQIKDFQDYNNDPASFEQRMREKILAELSAQSDDDSTTTAPAQKPRRTVDLSTRRNAAGTSTAAPPDPLKELFPE